MSDNNNNKRLSILVDGTLPWDTIPGERKRQVVATAIVLLLLLLFLLLLEMTPLPERDRREAQELPDRLAKLVLEKEKEPPPPEPEPEPEEEPEPEPEPEEEPEPEPEPEPTPDKVEKAREKAKQELKVFEDSLAGLRDIAPVVNNPTNLRKGGGESTKIERNLITGRAGSTSGGIAVGSVSSGGGGGGTLESGQVAQVESTIADKAEASTTRTTADGKSRRTEEQIRRIFDRYAGRINSAYQRALRKNPALQGTVVLSLVIDPSGAVTDVKVKSSELNDPDLERKVQIIVSTMDFGALNVEVWKGDYPINFFPS
ncbi:MAG: AgmX/PglI C-terminal domain-containing protein [Alcanivoracaceae bacterium]|jgi:TonB family protein|nr:AgmX/PglI C-terminal domain-containing protein [Alcanivoracaceae bacterium]